MGDTARHGGTAWPYRRLSEYLRERFGCRVRKIPLDAGLTCPNRDGAKGSGGCAYCVEETFSPALGRRSVAGQVAEALARPRNPADRFIAYFQPASNTYAPVDRLRELYDQAVSAPEIVVLAVGTRPDCAPDAALDLLQSYTSRVDVWVEYGLQSAHDRTLARINRGHGFAEFAGAVERSRGRGLRIGAHVILGLPGETRQDMMETAERLDALGVDAVKLHHLYVARGSALEPEYAAGRLAVLSEAEYVPLACDFLERLSPDTVIDRIIGESLRPDMVVAPQWTWGKARVIQAVVDEFRRRGTRQGARSKGV